MRKTAKNKKKLKYVIPKNYKCNCFNVPIIYL